MLAATLNRSADVGDPPSTIAAGVPYSASVGIGGTLEQFPSALTIFPESCGGAWCSGQTLRPADQPGMPFESAPQVLLNLPTDFPGLTLPTHVEVSVVEAASARVAQQGGTLTEAEMRHVLAEAGWPEALFAEALAVAWCESKWSPHALGDGGRSAGLFQLNIATWFRYAGEDAERWADPLVNARVAWATYQYDIGRGYEPWRQWSCKPT